MLPLVPIVAKVSIAVATALPGLIAHEKIVNKPYIDSAGVRTVCIGETQGIEDREYSDTECILMAAQRLAKDFEAPVRACSPYDEQTLLMQHAILSFVYNVGTNAYCHSSVAKYLRKGDIHKACDSFLLWNKHRIFNHTTGDYERDENGKIKFVVSPGLDKRRKAERKLCLSGLH